MTRRCRIGLNRFRSGVGKVSDADTKFFTSISGYTYVFQYSLRLFSNSQIYRGMELLTQITIADITALKWRGLDSSHISSFRRK